MTTRFTRRALAASSLALASGFGANAHAFTLEVLHAADQALIIG